MFDKDRFKACVDWYHANLDSLLPAYRGKYVACTENGVVASGGTIRGRVTIGGKGLARPSRM